MATLKPLISALLMGTLLVSCKEAGPSRWKLYFFVSTECPLCQEYFPHIDSIMQALPEDSFYTVAVFPAKFEPGANEAALREMLPHADEVVIDKASELSRKMKATVTPEVMLMKDGQMIYRGLIDNWPRGLGQKGLVTERYLEEALMAVRASVQPVIPETKPIGCIIEY